MNETFLIGQSPLEAAPDAAAIGGKAANLVRLHSVGLRVPPAIVLTTDACRAYLETGTLPRDFPAVLGDSIRRLEAITGLRLGDPRHPLLLSVRSSPPISMPGMLETVLNVGLTEEMIAGVIRRTGNPWLAWDAFRRLTQSFAETIYDAPVSMFDSVAGRHLSKAEARSLQELDALALRDLTRESLAVFRESTGAPLPGDALAQLVAAVEAVFRSWMSPRAREYRRLNGIHDRSGTAVLIQTMVFGNAGAYSGSGVGFTRNPATGDDTLYLDFLFNAQGEDVVAGRRPVTDGDLLPDAMPDVWRDLQSAKVALEGEFLDMQDFEFTVDDGQLFFLQTRSGKRTPWAALRIATDLVDAGLINRSCALERLAPYDVDNIVRVSVRPGPGDVPIAQAIPASVGAVTGGIVFDAERAQELGADRTVVLVRSDLSTDDITGLSAAAGLVTTYGGRTSHAAVVARQLGKACLVGCADLHVDEAGRVCAFGGRVLTEGELITLDGETGSIYAGHVPVVTERPVEALAAVRSWRH